MNNLARAGMALFLIVVGALIGSLATFFYVTRPLLVGSERTNRLWLQSEAYARYRFGDYPSARRALLIHAQLAEMAAEDVKTCDKCEKRAITAELAMAYGRLFVLASRADQAEDQKTFFSKATALCAPDRCSVTEDQLRAEVTRYDESWNADFKAVQ